MTAEDEEPTEEELQEAEALARALDRGQGSPHLPEDALGAAAFLRYAKDGGTLAPERAQAIFEDALRGARKKTRAARVRFVFGVLGFSALAALGVIALARRPTEPTALPPPPRALLESEVEAASNRPDLDGIGKAMDGYRTAVFATLEERYRR